VCFREMENKCKKRPLRRGPARAQSRRVEIVAGGERRKSEMDFDWCSHMVHMCIMLRVIFDKTHIYMIEQNFDESH
jgi:hypothetical protein